MGMSDEMQAIALELDHLRAMQGTEGWKVMDKEARAYLDIKFESLASCNVADAPKIQGMIAGVRWLMGHTEAVAQRLEAMQDRLKQETTE